MKNYIFSWVTLLCIILTSNTFAQDTINKNIDKQYNFTEQFDSLQSKGLITNRIPFGVLYNRVYGLGNLGGYVPVIQTNQKQLSQAWYDLTTATYKLTNSLSYDQLYDKIDWYSLSQTYPIIAFDYNYAIIDT